MSAHPMTRSSCKKTRCWSRQKSCAMFVAFVLLVGVGGGEPAQVHAAVVSAQAFNPALSVAVEHRKEEVESGGGAEPLAARSYHGRGQWEGLLSFELGRTTFDLRVEITGPEPTGWNELKGEEHVPEGGAFWSRIVERAEWIPVITPPPLSLIALLPLHQMERGSATHSAPERVPLPGTILLFGSGLSGLVGIMVRFQGPHRRQESGCRSTGVMSRVGGVHAIFLVTSDEKLAIKIEDPLQQAGYQIRVVSSVAHMLAAANVHAPALLLIDRRISEWDILRTEPALIQVPILIVVPPGIMADDSSIVADLERGADGVFLYDQGDRLFLAVIGSYCRRVGHGTARRGAYQVGHVRLDADTREVTIAGQAVHLSAKQFDILHAFMSEPARVFSRKELIDRIWGPDFAVGQHTLDVHIHALRRLLDRDTDRCCAILSIKGVGFKFKVFREGDDIGFRREQTATNDAAEQNLLNVWGNGKMNSLLAPSVEPPVSWAKSTATLLGQPLVPLRLRTARGDRGVMAKRCRVG